MKEDSLFKEDSRNLDAEEIRSILINKISDTDMISALTVKENKDGSIIIKFDRDMVCKVIYGKKQGRIVFKNYECIDLKSEKVVMESSIDDYIDLIAIAYIKAVLSKTGDAFACCHRYEECSDAKKCIHPNFIVSLGCSYKKNLEHDKIFYGKNKNI